MQEKAKNNFGLYTHVPFCATTCDFCAFYQEKPIKADIKRYLSGIKNEINHYKPHLPDNPDTFFWGGGTPGLLTASDLYSLGSTILAAFKNPPVEWSIEMAPSTVKPDKIQALKDLGVTRISMGVQSFNDASLDALGRLHSSKKVYEAYDTIRNQGFNNVNLDLIFAIPNQTFTDWQSDLQKAVELDPEHISTYCLTFEEDTALYVKLSQGKISRSIENEAQFYEKTWQILENAGYPQYEISNFAKPGHECQHNLDTWNMQQWLGLGPSASSQFQHQRFTNPFSLEDWLKNLDSSQFELIDHLHLDDNILAADSLIFGLRMNQGINMKELTHKYPIINTLPNPSFWDQLLEENLIERNASNLRLTPQGRLVADKIASEILEYF